MATTRTRYVNPDSSGGNGTTAALSGANAAYASLNLCLALEAADLVAADVYLEVFCATNGSADGAVYVDSADGWVCDATRNIRIRAADGHRAGTKWNTSKYRIEAGLTCITSTVPYTHIDGLQVRSNDDDNGLWCFVFSAVGCVVSNCLGRLPEGTFTYGNYCGYIVGPVDEDGEGDAPTVVYNSVFYGGPSNRAISGIRADNSWLEVYNCTLSGNGYTGSIGIRDGYGHVTAKNNLVEDFETPFHGPFDETDYNATDTTSSYVGANGRQSQTFSFVAADDFALTGSDAGARDYGVTDPSSGMFTDDILGTERAAPWDIGAHEYTAASTLEGAATASATAAGSVSVTKPLAGDATGAATAGGAATVGKPLSGAADGSASAQGGISVTKPLAGAASGSAIAQAGASVAKPVAGSAASSATAQADLTVTSGAVSHELGGDAAGAGSASASLSVTKPLAGAAAGTAGAQGGLAVAKPLAGDAQGQASAAGDLTLVGHVDLAGDAATAAQAAADLTVTPAVALEAPRGGDDAPGHGHRGWDRRRATLRRKREHEFTEQIRDLYRALTSDPATAERAEAIVGAVVPPAPVRGETEAAHEAAQLVRAEALRQRADALDAEAVQAEIALRLLYREYRERQEREDLDALGVLLPALLGVAPEPFAAGREALAGELWSDDYDMDALQVLLAEVL